jgi:hypothetical protein
MNENETLTGTLIGIRDCGTLVVLVLDAGDGRTVPISLEHRAFQHLLDGEECSSTELVGRSVSYNGDLVTFLE